MLGARQREDITEIVDKYFVGGTVYQAHLDPWSYHRWHSPVDGTLLKCYKLGGTYFYRNPSYTHYYEHEGAEPDNYTYFDSQPFLSIVSVRQVFIIKLKNSNYHIALI